MQSIKVIISGGGTGGHIFPAIAIAQTIQKRYPEAEILFVGANGRMEMEKVPAAGFEIVGLNISGIQRKLTLKNLAVPFKIIGSLLKARKIVKSFKPDVAIGVGGYASGPLLKAAAALGVPTVLQEQNSFPGITNKLLAKKADRICVAYEGLEKWFPKEKIQITGNPIRKQIHENRIDSKSGKKFFGLDPEKLTVLVVGGSLGAGSVNVAICRILPELKPRNIQLIWQTGKPYHEEALKMAGDMPEVSVNPFIKEMEYAYGAADVIVSRAGAMAISELSLIGKPSILIPYPFASEDHQTHNAMSLVNKDAARLIADEYVGEKLKESLFELMADSAVRSELSDNLKQLGRPQAAEDIVDEIIKVIG